jgi:transposase
MIHFFYKGGQHNETFANYFSNLMKAMKEKYPEKKLVYIMDNLWAHKSSLVMRIMQENKAFLLFTPSNTPQFSPIENMFGLIKNRMKDYYFKNKEDTAFHIMNEMFGLNLKYI